MDVPLAWMAMRSTGVVALVALTVAVVVGLIGPLLSPTARLTTVTMHRAATATGTLLLVPHIVLAVVDSFVAIDVAAVVVPGSSTWQPWGIGVAALAVDLLLVVIVSSALRRHLPVLWRRLHLLAIPMWALTWWHALSVGSDAASAPMRWLAIGCVGSVALALTVRLAWSPRRRTDAATRPAQSLAPSGAR